MRVVWASQDIGDGLGFDVLSFDDGDESEKLIEVKTTGLGKFFPFYVTGNEVRCSEDVADQFHLFRVFDFGRTPRAYILTGPLEQNCRLEPTPYRAMIRLRRRIRRTLSPPPEFTPIDPAPERRTTESGSQLRRVVEV